MMLAVICRIWPLLCWGMFYLYPLCWEFFVFNHKSMLNFAESFFFIYWDNVLFSFQLFIWCVTLIDLWILNHPSMPWINLTWLWYMIFLLMYCWIWFANNLLKIFLHMCSSSILICNFFVCGIFLWFWYQHNAGLVKWVWKWPFLFNFLE